MTDKKEWLFVKFSDGRTYKIPAQVIAEHRANYFVSLAISLREAKSKEQQKDIFNDEIDFALADEYELEDWATNNMDWPDVKEFAELVREKQVDYSREWVNAEKWTE